MESFEPGKVFGELEIRKTPTSVIMRTATDLITGDFHVRGAMRLIDELNHEDKFAALTNAQVIGPDGSVKVRSKFMAVNRDQIIWLLPKTELEETKSESE
jgi:hypothetical protein